MKDKYATLIGGAVGAGLGYAMSKTSQISAQAAVKVRPKLAEVGPVDAMLTEHFSDWLFYNHPTIGTGILVVLLALICAAAALSFNEGSL